MTSLTTTEYRPLILHVAHGSARGDVGQNGVADLSLHTSVDALADGLLNLYRTDATAAHVLGEVLARLAGVTEYTSVMGTDAERWNALILEQMEKVATLTRERDEARADVESLRKALSKSSDHLLDAMADIARLSKQITTPTPGAQA